MTIGENLIRVSSRIDSSASVRGIAAKEKRGEVVQSKGEKLKSRDPGKIWQRPWPTHPHPRVILYMCKIAPGVINWLTRIILGAGSPPLPVSPPGPPISRQVRVSRYRPRLSAMIDPPDPDGGHYFHTWCPYVRPSIHTCNDIWGLVGHLKVFRHVDPPDPDGQMDGHCFHTWCPYVLPKKQKHSTTLNGAWWVT